MHTMRGYRAGCFLVGIATPLLAAMHESASAQAIRTRDSAGVTIVENPSRARAQVTFRLGTTPLFDIGGPEEPTDNEFSPNQGYLRAARLSTNGFAVIDVARVHFFDARGQRLRIVGRAGGGPQEFGYLISICRTQGDTIVVSDSRNARLGIIEPNGVIVRTVRHVELGVPPFNGCLDDGTLLLERSSFEPGQPRTTRINRVRLDGTIVNTLGEFSFLPFDMVTQSEATVMAWNQRVYIGDPRTSEIRVLKPGGQLMQIIRSADPPRRITAAEAETRMRMTIPRNGSSAEVEERMARMRAQPRAAAWPAYRRMHVDPRGTLWVQDYVVQYPADDGWTAFDVQGRLLGRLTIPREPRLQVISFGLNQILVRRQDEDGFAHLTLFPIETINR